MQDPVAIAAKANALLDLIHCCLQTAIACKFVNLAMVSLDDVVEIQCLWM
jgi:hypothetical protein